MPTKKYLYVFISLFFLLTISNAFAVIPVEINKTITDGATGTNPRHFRCTNSTAGTGINCYHIWYNVIQQYNQTLYKTGQCSLNYTGGSCSINSLAVLNDTHILNQCGSASCFLWDVSDIENNNCSLVKYYSPSECGNFTDNVINSVGVIGSSMYIPRKNSITNSITFATSSSYWNTSYDWGYGSQFTKILSIPDRASSSVIYVSAFGEASTYINSPLYKYLYGALDAQISSINDMFGIKSTCNRTWYDLIKNNTGSTLAFIYDGYCISGTSRVYLGDFSGIENYTSDCNYNGEPSGTTCADANIYRTNTDGCHVIYESCPSGTLCTAFTPVINATTDIGLVENWTGCSIKTAGGAIIPCSNVCYNSVLLYSNCQGYANAPSECMQCPDSNGGFYVNSTYGFYTKNWYSNQTTFSASGNTIGCFNPTTSTYDNIINTLGNATDEIGILTHAGNNVTEATTVNNVCVNTSTSCYDASCNPVTCYSGNDAVQSTRAWFNAGLGTPFGADIISLISSGIISIWLFIVSKEKKIEVIMGVFLLVAGVFSFIGFLTSWFLVLEAGMIFVLIFWKVRNG